LLSPFASPHMSSPRPAQQAQTAGIQRREPQSGSHMDPVRASVSDKTRQRDDDYVETKKARDFADIRALPDGDVIGELKTHLASLGERKILIACYSEGARQRLRAMLDAGNITGLKNIDSAEQLKSLTRYE